MLGAGTVTVTVVCGAGAVVVVLVAAVRSAAYTVDEPPATTLVVCVTVASSALVS